MNKKKNNITEKTKKKQLQIMHYIIIKAGLENLTLTGHKKGERSMRKLWEIYFGNFRNSYHQEKER